MQRFTTARALAYAIAAAGSFLALSGASAADDATLLAAGSRQAADISPIVVASLNAGFTEPNDAVVPSGLGASKQSARRPRGRTTITGDASFYDENGKTSSGERYDPKAFTAAAQILLRGQFGGIRYGKNYQPSYGVAEYGGRKAIIRFNDVGPLAPGRAFDFSVATMKYFDGIELGVLPHVTVTLLPLGRDYAQGPVTDTELAAIEAEVSADSTAAVEIAAAGSAALDARCGSDSLALQPLSLEAIRGNLVRTASLDAVVPAEAIAGDGLEDVQDNLPNDLGVTASAETLP